LPATRFRPRHRPLGAGFRRRRRPQALERAARRRPLTLAQSGVIAAFKDTLVVGQGRASWASIRSPAASAGTCRWRRPRGTNEVERLADLVGPAARVGNRLCARAFQAAVGCVDGDAGKLLWSKNVGGTDAVGADAEYVFGADASDRMTAWRLDTGLVGWTSEALLYRGLSAPAVLGGSVVYADTEGTLHWLSRDKGEAQLRLPTDGSGIAVPPVVSGGTLLAVTRSGGVFAFRAR
jgi:outer membrane protein assembly factor BamB